MGHYVQNLSEEAFKQYQQILDELRGSKKYQQYENEQSLNEKLKLSLELFKDFEKKAKDIPDFKQERTAEPQKSFLDRLLHRQAKPKTYTSTYVQNAFFKEMQFPGSFKQTYNEYAANYNEFHKFTPHKQAGNGVVVLDEKGQAVGATTRSAYETISELRGTSKPNAQTKQDKTNQSEPLQAKYEAYAALDDHQFALALAQAETNLVRLEHFGYNEGEIQDRREIFGDMLILLTEAQKRFPNVNEYQAQQGSYFKDKDVRYYESLIFAYSKEAGKDNPVINEENKRIESWRQGKEYQQVGSVGVVEQPFQNTALYSSYQNPNERRDNAYKTSFKRPLEAAKASLSQSQLAAEKAKVSTLHIR